MRKTILFALITAIFLLPEMTFAGYFAPEPLKISAPSQIGIQYGYPFTFPFTLSGGPASVGFAIFTKDRGATIQNARNGYLGWHYMNRIDTCMYVSSPRIFSSGSNTITWDGLDDDGYHMIIFQHRYYFWAYDSENPPQGAFSAFRGYGAGRSVLVERDTSGNPLANPVFYSTARSPESSGETWNTRARWVIGGDPDDLSLLETTRYRSHPDRGRMAMHPGNHRLFFTQALESGKMVSREWEWTPNGDAVLQTNWGVDWMMDIDSALDPDTAHYSGPVTIYGDCFCSTDLAQRELRSFPALDFFDVNDGTHVKRFDLTPWFGEDAVPTELAYQNDRLLLSLPESSLFQVVSPYMNLEDESSFILWENGIGDGFADTLPAPGEPRSAAMDRNGFVYFTDNGSAPSIGVFASDGTGVGFFSLPGMTGSRMDDIQVIDTGSSFDGIYFETPDSGGDVRYVRYAMCEGKVVDPSEWFMDHVFIVRPWMGDILPAGKNFPLTWHATGCGALLIEFSADNGVSWTTVKDNIPEPGYWGEYAWTVPDIRSTTCRLRLSSKTISYLTCTSGLFTIAGVSAVDDESSPHPFITVSNSPNPFNPSTFIHYTLGKEGLATLSLYNALGQQVRRVDLGRMEKGAHEYRFDGSGLTSGVYLYRIATEYAATSGRMLLMK